MSGTRTRRKAAMNKMIIEVSSDSDDEPTTNKKAKSESSSEYEEPAESTKRTVKKRVYRSNKDKADSKPTAKKRTRKNKDLAETDENLQNNSLSNPPSNTQTDGPRLSRFSLCARKKLWEIPELLAESEHLDFNSAKNIVELFKDDNTIPFICRYRRDLIPNNITPEKLRDIKNTYTEILNLKKRAETIVEQLEKDKILTPDIRMDILGAKTTEELEFLYSPFKPCNKGSLADRAKAAGLETYAEYLLYGDSPPLDLNVVVDKKKPEIDTTEKVFEGICHIISHVLSKDSSVLEELQRLKNVHRILLKCSKAKLTKDKAENPPKDADKYELYSNFENSIKYIKPHQILAINRGEKSKILSVKIVIPDLLKNDIKFFIRRTFMSQGVHYSLRTEVFEKSFEECYTKKIQPYLSRQIRSALNEDARKASIDVFAKNLKQLFLMSPLKGEKILGIDPGFTNGCKLALISETTEVLETGVIYPHTKYGDPEECGERLAKMLTRHDCRIIALGNGTACRETEFWLTKLFQYGILDPQRVKYSIVSEQGASIYSCSEIAKAEFPNMDVNLISAASIARRLNDPLSEYVKIEPRHIGVGMYQHDINEKLLTESLNEVVMECVSYVGVDINTASLSVLKHIAGFTASKAQKIIEYRLKNGPFKTRKDLLKVKTVGEKTFTQCAGFVRIEPKSVGGTVSNILDCTWIHPESYDVAKKIIAKCKLDIEDLGEAGFISKIKQFSQSNDLEKLETELKSPKERIKVVLDALQRELFRDYRSDFDKKPLFKQGVTKMTELEKGSIVTGAVSNITHFGAFVDIGVETDGLIHISKMNGMVLNIGDRVETKVMDVDVQRKRVQLSLEGLAF